MDTTTAWKNGVLFYQIGLISWWLITFPAFVNSVLMPFSRDETLLPRSMNLSTSFREPPFHEGISPLWLKHMYSVLFAFTLRHIPPTAQSRLCCRNSAWPDVFTRSVMSSALSAYVIFRVGYCLLLDFSIVRSFSFIKSIDVRSQGRLWIDMVQMCPLKAHLRQCQRSLYLHPVRVLLLSCKCNGLPG